MIKSEQASLSVMRIAVITIIAIFSLSACVLAASVDVKNVKIVLSDNCEIDVLTTKSVVSEILEENHIVVLPEESVVPNLDSEITDSSSKIVITGLTQDAYSVVAVAEEEERLGLEQLLSAYNTITEKIVEVEEEIPFETETKDEANHDEPTTTVTLQEGEEGLKRVTYKTKYQNDIEINRTLINEEVIKDPVNKIEQVSNITSRSSSTKSRTSANSAKTEQPKTEKPASNGSSLAQKVEGIEPIVKTMNASAYSPSSTGSTRTASGATATAWYTIAAGKGYPMGTIMYIPYFANQANRRMVCCAR